MLNSSYILTEKDLPNEDLKIVADIFGLQIAIKLMYDLPGIVINVPKNGFLKMRNQYILEQYDGTKASRKALAKEFNLTEGYIIQLYCRAQKGKKI